jgi:hypothetical protein
VPAYARLESYKLDITASTVHSNVDPMEATARRVSKVRAMDPMAAADITPHSETKDPAAVTVLTTRILNYRPHANHTITKYFGTMALMVATAITVNYVTYYGHYDSHSQNIKFSGTTDPTVATAITVSTLELWILRKPQPDRKFYGTTVPMVATAIAVNTLEPWTTL